eukprot:715370-Pelagomonas_calceolata.AAC.2
MSRKVGLTRSSLHHACAHPCVKPFTNVTDPPFHPLAPKKLLKRNPVHQVLLNEGKLARVSPEGANHQDLI